MINDEMQTNRVKFMLQAVGLLRLAATAASEQLLSACHHRWHNFHNRRAIWLTRHDVQIL